MTFVMIDPTPNEIQALTDASDKAGEYLDSVGKTDIAALSFEQWMTLIEVIVTGYVDKVIELDRASRYLSVNRPPL